MKLLGKLLRELAQNILIMASGDSDPEEDYTPPQPREFTFTFSIKIPRISLTTFKYAWKQNPLRSTLSTSLFITGSFLFLITLFTKTTSTYIQWSAIGLFVISIVYLILSYWTLFEMYKYILTTLLCINGYLLYQAIINGITTLSTALFLLTVTLFFFRYYTAKTKTVGKTLTVPKNFQS